MQMVEEGTPNPGGEALVEELRWVHGIIRENLAQIGALAEHVAGGATAEEIRDLLEGLSATNVVWTLRRGCLRYCALVHMHHHGEDTHFFPGLRRVNPTLRPVIDKLETDHVAIAGYLDRVEAAARHVEVEEQARAALTGALQDLAAHLIAHLDYEEANLNPTLRRLTDWPMQV